MLDEPLSTWDQTMQAHERSLVVGARVRVMPGEGCHSHGEQEAGVTGVIIDTDAHKRPSATHRYLVLFDRPLRITVTWLAAWYYCAAELTVIPWRTPEEIVADTLRRLEDAGATRTRKR